MCTRNGCTLYLNMYIFFFLLFGRWYEGKNMGTFEKLIQLFCLIQVVSQFNHTHKYTRIHIHWLIVYIEANKRTPAIHSLISKLGKQIIIFVLYACIVVKIHTHTHTHTIYVCIHNKETNKKRETILMLFRVFFVLTHNDGTGTPNSSLFFSLSSSFHKAIFHV